jgi:hypothetical protein
MRIAVLLAALACLPTGSLTPLAPVHGILRKSFTGFEKPSALLISTGVGNRTATGIVRSYSFSVRGANGDTARCSMNTKLLSEHPDVRKAEVKKVTEAFEDVSRRNMQLMAQIQEESGRALQSISRFTHQFKRSNYSLQPNALTFESLKHPPSQAQTQTSSAAHAPGSWALAQVEKLHAKLAQVSANGNDDEPRKVAPANVKGGCELDGRYASFETSNSPQNDPKEWDAKHNGDAYKQKQRNIESMPSAVPAPEVKKPVPISIQLDENTGPKPGTRANASGQISQTQQKAGSPRSTDEAYQSPNTTSKQQAAPVQPATDAPYSSESHSARAQSLKGVSRQRGILDLAHEATHAHGEPGHEHAPAKSREHAHRVGASFEDWFKKLERMDDTHV